MDQQLRVLHLEDNEADGELVARSLRKAGFSAEITRVDDRQAFLRAVQHTSFDLVLSDFSLPDFDGLSALAAFREVDSLTPFIFVSGTIGEERAVQALHDGATDYILKDRLSRLPSALARSLAERQEREAREIAEERIREQASLLDEAREAIVVKDLSRRVTYWNHGAELLYGWSAEEAVAGAAEARFPQSAMGDLERAWQTVLTAGQWDGSFRQRTRDGREMVVDGHWTCLRHPDGRPRAVLSIGTDVTEARELESRLLRAQRLETVGMIAGGVAHDLNNVLAPILIGIASLKRRVTDDTGQRLLATMETGVERGADIVRQVLGFARGARSVGGSVDAGKAVRGIEKLVVASLSKSVELTIRVAPDLWPVDTDATQIQQVLLNLCVNARDAMPSGGRLSLHAENVTRTASHPGRYVLLRVTDTGQGMSEAVRQKIFDPFYTTKAEGTGIGLATVAEIVKRHGGLIEVDSEVSRGTEFRVFLPAHVSEATPRATADVRGGGRLVLVVDEGSLREILKHTLEAYGYRVMYAEARAAVSPAAQNSGEIAAVLVNFSLPGLDADWIRRLIAENPRMKIVTSGDETDLPDWATSTVVHATLPRPYSAETLVETMGRVLENA